MILKISPKVVCTVSGAEPQKTHLQQTVTAPLISFLCVTYCIQTPATLCVRTFCLAVGAPSAYGGGHPEVWRVNISQNPQPMTNKELKGKYHASFHQSG